jgi:uncharacterized protein YjbI with pentapeptide repeats
MGYQTEVSQDSQDGGVDIQAINVRGEKHLIQVKRYGADTTVGGRKIREYGSLYQLEDGVDNVYVVTTNEFTSQAKEMADKLDVKLVNGTELADRIEQNKKIVREYFSDSRSIKNTSTVQKTDPAPDERKGMIHPHADLHKTYLSDFELDGENLRNADLSKADLSGASLEHADLTDANLSEANLFHTNLRHADLTNANLSNAYLSDADLSNANLTGTNLRGANLCNANLKKAYLRPTTIENAAFGGAQLSGVNLNDSHITKSDLPKRFTDNSEHEFR